MTTVDQSEPQLWNISGDNESIWMNETDQFFNPFHVPFYRFMFIVIYGVIFTMCVIGNILILVVATKSTRMKTRTNFFLANLAAADLCVGVFCVLPNLLKFLYLQWLLGQSKKIRKSWVSEDPQSSNAIHCATNYPN
ncbi:neuropeptide receptor a31 [Plakobranchus ocellatus]|uniref:Neuropeptide receptor a31 n=1 Tax=Plakobranchus ocellatus TaxID=259542 RepID=A0AAV4CSD6_9GAST|nr:neuropeptide receptor a31 [Plakobranchus ocellatus]